MSENLEIFISKAWSVLLFLIKRFFLGYWKTLEELNDIHSALFEIKARLDSIDQSLCEECLARKALEKDKHEE